MRPSVGCCVLLFLAVTSVSAAVRKLNSIQDLKEVDFGQDVPAHSLLLLHWFANQVEIDNNDAVWLRFDPNTDYGSHHYGNYEGLLDSLPPGSQYYTVGNVNEDTHGQLPDYVRRPPIEDARTNQARIVFRVRQHRGAQRIDGVYITQHLERSYAGTEYDPDHTYQVSTNLLRQIRQFPLVGNQNSLSQLRNTFGSNADESMLRCLRQAWGGLACLGLLLFIVIDEKTGVRKQNRPQRSTAGNGKESDACTTVEVVTGTDGNARISWRNVVGDCLKKGVFVALYKDEARRFHERIRTSNGFYDTQVPLNDGLQARLHQARKQLLFWTTVGPEIYRSTEFHSPGAVDIGGYQARLQLFVKDGKASARLYVSKSFSGWKSEFKRSWVGFYTSADKGSDEYEWWQWQWVTRFTESSDYKTPTHVIYEYESSMNIAPGVQARFILRKYDVQVRTPSWK